MPTELSPGTITTLGALRPGDVGEWCGFGEGAPKFVVVKHMAYPGFGVCVDAAYDGGGGISEPFLSRPVRYLGRGRIEPAKIVIEGESDRVAELADAGKILSRLGYSREAAEMQEVADAMGEQLRRIAELETQVLALQKLVKPKSDIPCCVKCGRWMSEHWDFPDRCEGFVIPETIELTIAATAPKGEP